MRQLAALKPCFWKYRRRLLLGILFIFISNYFAVLAPLLTGFIIDLVKQQLPGYVPGAAKTYSDPLLQLVTSRILQFDVSFTGIVALCGVVLLLLALLRGAFMFLMRQTIIVMSRHIEFDQKNEVFRHYLQLDTQFFKTHETGDLMNRVAEDVSRVRMYTGPAIMYLINLTALILLSVFYMVKKNAELSLYVLAPLPVLAITIYFVNIVINRKSETVQALLSDLTTNAQQSYAGIRVIKSFVQEHNMLSFFRSNSEAYRRAATGLYKTEAMYFPAMALVIGVSTLLVIYSGGMLYMKGDMQFGDMAAFIMYLTMLTFPVSAIGWVASTIQRAAASQRRINEFLNTVPAISLNGTRRHQVEGAVSFRGVTFTYPHTGITALRDFNLEIRKGERVAILGKTGSGKTSIAQLLLRFYDPTSGEILVDGIPLRELDLPHYRRQISYVPQDVFLFSDTITGNIAFGSETALPQEQVETAARRAALHTEVTRFSAGYNTVVGERGVTLSGGQKQRLSIARAIVKEPALLILDDCLNAVDVKTEATILAELQSYLQSRTALVITHRIFSLLSFDRILVMDDGCIAESGTHEELLRNGGLYAAMHRRQLEKEQQNNPLTS
ncbi:MAG TPA: ABC transporter ATP-binding protein [Lacibacter sp.]|nr:ABC transporter ATP-binding protein [Lacibacter sp.]HMO89067.1 ABC transporter ATP-binding protein [Lacibacter sp.]